MISKSLEEYLKTMYVLQKQNGEVRVTEIANKMNCTKPSVNKSLKLLKEENLVKYEAYGSIEITEEGIKCAKKALEAQDIIYTFLTQILELDNDKAKIEAKNMKLSLSDDVLNKLAKYVHKTLGLYSLDCGYDINNERCINCKRRTLIKKDI